MTEEEAREKWCPFARVTDLSRWGPSSNRWGDDEAQHKEDDGGIQPGAYCIASKCMAWRWDTPNKGEYGEGGFCGLAGKDGWIL